MFKFNFEFEKYLTIVPFCLRKYLIKFRTLNEMDEMGMIDIFVFS